MGAVCSLYVTRVVTREHRQTPKAVLLPKLNLVACFGVSVFCFAKVLGVVRDTGHC